MKKSFIRLFFISLFVFVFASLNIGSSDFVVNGEVKVDNITINGGDRAVCYIDGSDPTKHTYFTTIERALEVAGDNTTAETIYVIPDNVDKNVTITRNCTVSANDTLILPYQDKLWDYREGKTKLRNRFADDCEAMVEQNRKTVVKIQKGVTLTVNGTLNIGGILGNASSGYQGLQGQTSGYYSEILMEAGTDIHASGGPKKGAKIEVNGTLDCRGYIKETVISDDINIQPQLVLNNQSNTKLPFVIYDYQGANGTGGIYCGDFTIDLGKIIQGAFGGTLTPPGKACPFVLFDIPNVQILTKINSGANVDALVSLHTDEKTVTALGITKTFKESWNTDHFALIGNTNSLLSIESGYITTRYKPANLGYTEVLRYLDNPTRTMVDFNGKCNFGAMHMTLDAQIAKVEINTKDILFPFSYRWAFNIRRGGKINVSNGIKLMNGCSLNINAGGTLELQNGARVAFYNKEGWNDHKVTIPYMPTYMNNGAVASLQNLTTGSDLVLNDTNSKVTGKTSFINNGTINLKSGASLGGLIQTDSESGKIIVEDGSKNTVDSLETSGSGGQDGLSYIFQPVNPQTLTEKAQMHGITDFTSLPLSDVSSGTYEGTRLNGSYGFGTRVGTATIKGDDSILPNATKTLEITDNSSHLLGDDFVWSCDDETKLSLNSKSGRSITVTGRECGKVNLSCDIRYKGKDIKTVTKSIKVGPNPTVTVDTSNIYDNPSDPYNIGGIGDYRDITVTMDKDCDNSRIEWVYDSSKVQLTQTSGSYPTFTYRFKTIAAGNDTLKFNYISKNVTENDCWTQAITIANNKRLKEFELDNPRNLSNNTLRLDFVDWEGTATIVVKEDEDLNNQIFFDDSCYTSSDEHLRVKSVSLSGSTLTIKWQGRGGGLPGSSSYSSKFRVYSKNGANGSVVKSSNELTITVKYKR